MFVNENHCGFSNNAGQSSPSDSTFRNAYVHRDVSTTHENIELTDCETIGDITTISGYAKVKGGSLEGQVKTGSGDISIRGPVRITGSLETVGGDTRIMINSSVSSDSQTRAAVLTDSGDIWITGCSSISADGQTSGAVLTDSGDISITGGSIISADGQTSGAVQTDRGNVTISDNSSVSAASTMSAAVLTTSGNIDVSEAVVNGQISTASGIITLSNATVTGGVTLQSNRVSIDESTVVGTLTANGNSLDIGEQSIIEKVVLKLPPDVSAATNSGSVPRIDSQTIYLGAGTEVGNIEYEATRCKVVLGPGAEYIGPRSEGMTVERKERCLPRINTWEHIARFVRQMINPVVAPPQSDPSVMFDSPAGIISSSPSPEISATATADPIPDPISAMNDVFSPGNQGPVNRRVRQEKMIIIGDQYIKGLQGAHASTVFFMISEMTPEDKAKVLTSLCYGTLLNVDLAPGNPVYDKLETLCKASTDIGDAIKGHIQEVDGPGIQSGLLAPAAGATRMLSYEIFYLPPVTEMMLDSLGLR